MVAFSRHSSPPVTDSLFELNSSGSMSNLLEKETVNSTCFSPIGPDEYLLEFQALVQFHETSSPTGTKAPFTCAEPSLNVKHHKNSSSGSMVAELETGDQVTKVVTPMENKRMLIDSEVGRESKGRKRKICNASKRTVEKELNAGKEANKKVLGEAPTGYIHVRARRGQATDSHSLAERVRREKISERMKRLQSLVPGCDKITGKAQILDEIINYVQSLQNQAELLEARLASVSSMFNDLNVDIDTTAFASEILSSLEPPLPPELQPSSTQVGSFAETTPSLTSILPQHEQRYNVILQDNDILFWDVDHDQRHTLVNQFGFIDFCPFP